MPSEGIHVCTIATRSHIAHARVLAESFLAHNPGGVISVLVIDQPAGAPELAGEPFQTLTLADVDLGQAELERRATMYSTQALACSLKPVLLQAMIKRLTGPVLYLDADGCIYASLQPVIEACSDSAMVVVPHMLDPYPLKGLDGPEQVILRAGIFNAGMVAAGPGAGRALEWWGERTARRSVFDERLGLVFDQTWLSLVPVFFPHHILRDRGCDVAGWNLHTRDIEWQGQEPGIEGGPLRHFHFAGSFDPEHPETITPIPHLASWWATMDQRPGAARLVREYAARLLASGYHEARSQPAVHDLMPDGSPIAPWMRESYRIALIEAEEAGQEEPPNPFSHGPQRFREWVGQRAAEAAMTSPAADEAPTTPIQHQALAEALLDSDRMLARIAELEGIRDDAVGWAQRVSAELQSTVAKLEEAEADRAQSAAELEQARALTAELQRVSAALESERQRNAETLASIQSSASWRMTKPLRQAKSALKGSPE